MPTDSRCNLLARHDLYEVLRDLQLRRFRDQVADGTDLAIESSEGRRLFIPTLPREQEANLQEHSLLPDLPLPQMPPPTADSVSGGQGRATGTVPTTLDHSIKQITSNSLLRDTSAIRPDNFSGHTTSGLSRDEPGLFTEESSGLDFDQNWDFDAEIESFFASAAEPAPGVHNTNHGGELQDWRSEEPLWESKESHLYEKRGCSLHQLSKSGQFEVHAGRQCTEHFEQTAQQQPRSDQSGTSQKLATARHQKRKRNEFELHQTEDQSIFPQSIVPVSVPACPPQPPQQVNSQPARPSQTFLGFLVNLMLRGLPISQPLGTLIAKFATTQM